MSSDDPRDPRDPVDNWPLVAPNDGGIRPAGPADACFYCDRKVGERHIPDCVIVHKMVKVRYIFEFEISVPYYWGKRELEYHRNDGTWCANNAIDDLENAKETNDASCLCPLFKAEFVETTDRTPTRELHTDAQMQEGAAIRNAIRKEMN